MKKTVLKLAKNKYVFYFFVLLAIINLLGYLSMRAWECMVMFAAVAYSTRCYVKNDTLAILAGLFVSNFVFSCNKMKENFEESMKHDKKKGKKKEDKGEANVDLLKKLAEASEDSGEKNTDKFTNLLGKIM